VARSTPVSINKEVTKLPQYTPQQVVAFGGINEEALRGVRSSGRLRAQPNTDATQMERAILIAKKRAETHVLGKSPLKPTSITAFTDDHIIDNVISLGVSLGTSHSECITSAKLIKDVELHRTLTMLRNLDNLVYDTASCLAVTRASDLWDDLDGDDFVDDEINEPLVIPNVRKGRKKKRMIAKRYGGATELDLKIQNINE
jgi:hypothetical protein